MMMPALRLAAALPSRPREPSVFPTAGEGVRAGWQESPKTPAGLQRITATVCGSPWQSDPLLRRVAEGEQAAADGAEEGLGLELDRIAQRRVVHVREPHAHRPLRIGLG